MMYQWPKYSAMLQCMSPGQAAISRFAALKCLLLKQLKQAMQHGFEKMITGIGSIIVASLNDTV
jgi:hypothetical protein